MQNGTTTSTPSWPGNRNRLRFVLLAGFLTWLAACEEPKDIGLAPTLPVGVLYTDTLTIRTSTIQFDSVWTDRTSRLLVGRYTDPVFGRVSAQAYAQFGLYGLSVFKTEADYTYDSLKISLSYGYSYGDTARVQEVFIHRLTDNLDSSKRYTNINTVSFSPEALTKVQFTPSSTSGESAFIRLPDTLGRELFDLSKGAGTSDADIRKVFKGLAFTPGAGNTAVIGLGTGSTLMRLYYHKNNEKTAISQDFALLTSLPAFSQVTVDRRGTKLAGLSVSNPLPPSATGGETYLQSATGVTTRIDFPTLASLKSKGRIAVNRAELTLTTKGNSPGGPIPPYLALAELNDTRQIPYTLTSGSRLLHLVPTETGAEATLPLAQYTSWAYPQIQPYVSRTRSYTFNVSRYLQSVLMSSRTNLGLALVPVSATGIQGGDVFSYINNQLNGVIFDGNTTAKLVVFYTYAP